MSAIGEYDQELYDDFLKLHERAIKFVREQYGSASVFEHGKFGQTVFHSHVHYLPFTGGPEDIVPEGADKLRSLEDLSELHNIYERDGGYLFFSIGERMWTVDCALAAPRFFRDRFANALGVPERGSWKDMRKDPEIMKTVKTMNSDVQRKWRDFFGERS